MVLDISVWYYQHVVRNIIRDLVIRQGKDVPVPELQRLIKGCKEGYWKRDYIVQTFWRRLRKEAFTHEGSSFEINVHINKGELYYTFQVLEVR